MLMLTLAATDHQKDHMFRSGRAMKPSFARIARCFMFNWWWKLKSEPRLELFWYWNAGKHACTKTTGGCSDISYIIFIYLHSLGKKTRRAVLVLVHYVFEKYWKVSDDLHISIPTRSSRYCLRTMSLGSSRSNVFNCTLRANDIKCSNNNCNNNSSSNIDNHNLLYKHNISFIKQLIFPGASFPPFVPQDTCLRCGAFRVLEHGWLGKQRNTVA